MVVLYFLNDIEIIKHPRRVNNHVYTYGDWIEPLYFTNSTATILQVSDQHREIK